MAYRGAITVANKGRKSLVCLVDFVYLVHFVCLVLLVCPDKGITSFASTSRAAACGVCLVCLVDLVCLVCLVGLVRWVKLVDLVCQVGIFHSKLEQCLLNQFQRLLIVELD